MASTLPDAWQVLNKRHLNCLPHTGCATLACYMTSSSNQFIHPIEASWGAQMVKNLPAVQETWVRSLGQEDPPEKEMATHSRTLACKIPWTEKPGSLQCMGLQRVGHDWATSFIHSRIMSLQFSHSVISDSLQPQGLSLALSFLYSPALTPYMTTGKP